MAFNSANLALISSVNGFGLYRYDTTDSLATVGGNGYMNNSDDNVNLAVGDVVEAVVWNTAVRSGTINDIGRHIVMQVVANAVDLSDDILGASPVTGT